MEQKVKKIYTYFVTQSSENIFRKIKTCNLVTEYPGAFVQADEKRFYTGWDDGFGRGYLPKGGLGESEIEKVVKGIHGTTAIYAVFLEEDDEEKAYALILEACKKDILDLKEHYRKELERLETAHYTIENGSVTSFFEGSDCKKAVAGKINYK